MGGDLVPGSILPGTEGSVSRGKGAAGWAPSRTQLPEGLRGVGDTEKPQGPCSLSWDDQ